ncbi:MAG: hypothetical protein ACLPKB_12175 [Xanthobacteraceae bacterium]
MRKRDLYIGVDGRGGLAFDVGVRRVLTNGRVFGALRAGVTVGISATTVRHNPR